MTCTTAPQPDSASRSMAFRIVCEMVSNRSSGSYKPGRKIGKPWHKLKKGDETYKIRFPQTFSNTVQLVRRRSSNREIFRGGDTSNPTHRCSGHRGEYKGSKDSRIHRRDKRLRVRVERRRVRETGDDGFDKVWSEPTRMT
jgi:hypothetical protein